MGFLLFLEIDLARFANSRVVLLPEVLWATHTNFDIFLTNWASYFAVVDCEDFVGFLKAGLCPDLLNQVSYCRLTAILVSPGSGNRSCVRDMVSYGIVAPRVGCLLGS